MATNPTIPATPHDAIRQIRASVKILAVMEAQGTCDHQAIIDADAEIEAALQVLSRRLCGDSIPVLTLGDVAAEARVRRVPAFTAIDGGRA